MVAHSIINSTVDCHFAMDLPHSAILGHDFFSDAVVYGVAWVRDAQV